MNATRPLIPTITPRNPSSVTTRAPTTCFMSCSLTLCCYRSLYTSTPTLSRGTLHIPRGIERTNVVIVFVLELHTLPAHPEAGGGGGSRGQGPPPPTPTLPNTHTHATHR